MSPFPFAHYSVLQYSRTSIKRPPLLRRQLSKSQHYYQFNTVNKSPVKWMDVPMRVLLWFAPFFFKQPHQQLNARSLAFFRKSRRQIRVRYRMWQLLKNIQTHFYYHRKLKWSKLLVEAPWSTESDTFAGLFKITLSFPITDIFAF